MHMHGDTIIAKSLKDFMMTLMVVLLVQQRREQNDHCPTSILSSRKKLYALVQLAWATWWKLFQKMLRMILIQRVNKCFLSEPLILGGVVHTPHAHYIK